MVYIDFKEQSSNNDMTVATARKLRLRLDLMQNLRDFVLPNEGLIYKFAPSAEYMPE